MTSLSVSYTCTGCYEEAESDGDTGLICRRCCVRFDGWSDGTDGEQMTRAEFTEWFGERKPQPSRAELLDELLPSRRKR